jgi:hypothetical protein
MKDQTLTDKNGTSLSSSTDKVANEKSTDRVLTSDPTIPGIDSIVEASRTSGNSSDLSPKSKFALLPTRILSNAIAKGILLFGVSFAGAFFIALAILRLTQPQITQTASPSLVAPTVTSSQSNLNRPRSLVDRIISLVSFGYLSGMPEAQEMKISKNSLPGTTLGKSWTNDTAFAPVTSLSAPPSLSSQPLQTISPSQLPPISFSIPPDAIPDALVPAPDSTDPTKNSNRAAIAENKPVNRVGSSQETVIELSKDTLGTTLTSGTSARATLVNAAVFSGNRNASSTPRFAVKLEESLKSPSGKLTLPTNTTLVTVVRPLPSKPGVAELEAVSVLVDGKEYDLPTGAITFLDSSGSSLVGLKYGDEEPANSRDETAKTAPSASKDKKTNNSNPSDSDNLDNSETTPSTSRPSPEQVKDGNKEAIENVMRRSQFYYIPQGTLLKLVVNQTVKL